MWMRRTLVAASSAVIFALALPALAADAPKKPAAKPADAAATAPDPARKAPAKAAAAAPAAPAVMPGDIESFWIMWPKAGKEMEFEAAVKAHLAWRKQAGEGWTWGTFQPVVGTDLTHYVFRSGEHHWADFDANQDWEMSSKANENFNRDVAPLVERYEHSLAKQDYENSHWIESPDYKYVTVEEHKLKSGMGHSVSEAVASIHKGLQAGGWAGSYAISRPMGGMGGLTLVFPYKNYAAMEDPKPGFMEVLTKGMGSADAAMAAIKKFDDGVQEVTTTIYAFRMDLSTPK